KVRTRRSLGGGLRAAGAVLCDQPGGAAQLRAGRRRLFSFPGGGDRDRRETKLCRRAQATGELSDARCHVGRHQSVKTSIPEALPRMTRENMDPSLTLPPPWPFLPQALIRI